MSEQHIANRMQRVRGKTPHVVAGGVVVGGLPLLEFIVLYIQLAVAHSEGHPYSGDGIGLAMMSVMAFGLALFSLTIGIAYFGQKWRQHQQRPHPWHAMALAWVAIEVAAPFLCFAVL